MKTILALFVLITLSLIGNNIVFAQEASLSASYSAQILPTGNEIGVSKITPASAFYFLKTIRENLEMKLALTPHVKLVRQLEFATRRLRESKSLVGNHEELIQPTLERYWSYLTSLPDKDLPDEEVLIRIKQSLTIHLEVLQSIYNKLTNPKAKLAVRSMIYRITKRADLPPLAKIPACYFLQKESTKSAIVESERAILTKRAEDCFKESYYRI